MEVEGFFNHKPFSRKVWCRWNNQTGEGWKDNPANAGGEYLEDANANLFDTPVIGAEVYQSDGGKDWKKVNKDFIHDFYYS